MIAPADVQNEAGWSVDAVAQIDAMDFMQALVDGGVDFAEEQQMLLTDEDDPSSSDPSNTAMVAVMLAAEKDPCSRSSSKAATTAPAAAAADAHAHAHAAANASAVQQVGRRAPKGLRVVLVPGCSHKSSRQPPESPTGCMLWRQARASSDTSNRRPRRRAARSTAGQSQTSLNTVANPADKRWCCRDPCAFTAAQADAAINGVKKAAMDTFMRHLVPGDTPEGLTPFTYPLPTDNENGYKAGLTAMKGYAMHELILTNGGAAPKGIPIPRIQKNMYQ